MILPSSTLAFSRVGSSVELDGDGDVDEGPASGNVASVTRRRSGAWYFRLKASGNNEVIGRSEMYVSKSNAERGRDAVLALIRNGEAH